MTFKNQTWLLPGEWTTGVGDAAGSGETSYNDPAIIQAGDDTLGFSLKTEDSEKWPFHS